MTKFTESHMTNQHPITPPTELVSKWIDLLVSRSDKDVLILATQWGADQELEACCEWTDEAEWTGAGSVLRRHRRPKPPSLNEDVFS